MSGMIYYVNAEAKRDGYGTADAPFRTITEAAGVAVAGDEVIVAPGVYRESVDPVNGGTDDKNRIVYRAEKPLTAIISGSETVKNWCRYCGDVWVARIPNGVFGEYNPYTTCVSGDWYFASEPVHTGEVYLNGKALYEVQTLNEVLEPQKLVTSWEPEFSVYKWYTCQDGDVTVIYANFQGADPNEETVEINVRRNCFMPRKTGVNYITLSGFCVTQAATQWAPPTAYQDGMVGPHWSKGWIIEDCEISNARCAGISLGKYLQPGNDNKWTTTHLKDGTQTERDVICRAQYEGWTKERIGSHIVRRCNIHDCGQAGIVGHLGCVFSVIEDNHIHHINNKQDLIGAEIGGIKMHAAIDVILRRNHIHHCTRGLWLDWQAQGTRVTQNLFHDNTTPAGSQIGNMGPGEDLFIEVSHGPTLVDNNVMLSVCAARLSTQGVAFAHNLIAGSFTSVGTGTDNGGIRFPSPRYTPYHVPHRTEVAGFMTILHGDMRFYNNIFVQQAVPADYVAFAKSREGETGFRTPPNFVVGTKPYDGYPTFEAYFAELQKTAAFGMFGSDKYYDHLPVAANGNVYFNGAQPCDIEQDFGQTEIPVSIHLRQGEDRYILETNLYDEMPECQCPFVDTQLLGEAFEPEQKFENPDGTPMQLFADYFGNRRNVSPVPGPFATGTEHAWLLAEYKLQ